MAVMAVAMMFAMATRVVTKVFRVIVHSGSRNWNPYDAPSHEGKVKALGTAPMPNHDAIGARRITGALRASVRMPLVGRRAARRAFIAMLAVVMPMVHEKVH